MSGGPHRSLPLPAVEGHEDEAAIRGRAALHGDAIAAHTPQSPWDGRGLEEVGLGKGRLDRVGGLARVIVRDRAVNVMSDVRCSDTVVQPVDERRVRPVDGKEGPAHIREVVVMQMGHVDGLHIALDEAFEIRHVRRKGGDARVR